MKIELIIPSYLSRQLILIKEETKKSISRLIILAIKLYLNQEVKKK